MKLQLFAVLALIVFIAGCSSEAPPLQNTPTEFEAGNISTLIPSEFELPEKFSLKERRESVPDWRTSPGGVKSVLAHYVANESLNAGIGASNLYFSITEFNSSLYAEKSKANLRFNYYLEIKNPENCFSVGWHTDETLFGRCTKGKYIFSVQFEPADGEERIAQDDFEKYLWLLYAKFQK